MTKDQITAIQEMFAPIFGCEPQQLEVGDGFVVKQPERLNERVHVWNVECDSPNRSNT